jgi:hypothetical protein
MQEQTKPKFNKKVFLGGAIALAIIVGVFGGIFFLGKLFVQSLASEPQTNSVSFVSNVSPQANQTETVVDLKIKGNKSSRIYHLKGCPNYEDIAERNIRWFKTEDEARTAGFRMAKNC